MPIPLVPLCPLVMELGIVPATGSLALIDGSVEFDESYSVTERAMTSAWESRALLPPQRIVTALRVINGSGEIVRAWATALRLSRLAGSG